MDSWGNQLPNSPFADDVHLNSFNHSSGSPGMLGGSSNGSATPHHIRRALRRPADDAAHGAFIRHLLMLFIVATFALLGVVVWLIFRVAKCEAKL